MGGRVRRRATYPGPLRGPRGPLFGLAPDWVCLAGHVTMAAVGSYPTIAPLPVTLARVRRFIFCDTIRRCGLNRNAPAFTGNPAQWCPDFPLVNAGALASE